MATRFTVTTSVAAIVGGGIDPKKVTAVVTTNLGVGRLVTDSAGPLNIGDGRVTVDANGDITMDLLNPNDAGLNVTGWSYYLRLTAPSQAALGGLGRGEPKVTYTAGPFIPDASGPLAQWRDQFDTPAVDPTWRDGFRTDMEGIRDQSAANLAAQTDLSQIATPDALVEALVSNPASLTGAALTATIGAGANLARVIARAKSGRPVKVVALGDSVLEGTNVTSGGGVLGADDVLSLVSSRIASRFGATSTKVNHALSGHTVAMGPLSLKWNAASTEQADLYLIAYKANDSAAERFSTPVRGYSLDAFAAGLERLFRRLRTDAPRADIAWVDYGQYNAASTAPENVALDKYSDRAREVCAAYGVEYIDARPRFRGPDGIAPNAALYADSIHPNKAGHAALADAIMEHLPVERPGSTQAMSAPARGGLYAPEKIGGGQDSGADFVLAPTAGKWVETGTWSTAGSARTSTTPGDKIGGTFAGTELYVMLDTSTAADLHATLVIDGSPVYTNQPFDAMPIGTSWVMLATGLAPGVHTWELILTSGTMTVARVGWLASVAGAYNADVYDWTIYSSGDLGTSTPVPTDGSPLTPLPGGSVYIDQPWGAGTTGDFATTEAWALLRVVGATTTYRTVRVRVLYDGADRRPVDYYVSIPPVPSGDNHYVTVDLSTAIAGIGHHKLLAVQMVLTSTDKSGVYLRSMCLRGRLARRS